MPRLAPEALPRSLWQVEVRQRRPDKWAENGGAAEVESTAQGQLNLVTQAGGTVPAVFENLTLTRQAAEHALATAILNAFVNNEDLYLCQAKSTDGETPPTSLLLAEGPTC